MWECIYPCRTLYTSSRGKGPLNENIWFRLFWFVLMGWFQSHDLLWEIWWRTLAGCYVFAFYFYFFQCYFPCIFLWAPFLILQILHFQFKNFVSLWRDLFLKLFLKREECAVFWYVSLWDRMWSYPLFPYLLITLSHTYFVSFMSLSYVLLSIDGSWVSVVLSWV